MSANSYLEQVAKGGIVRRLEKANIDRSLLLLQGRITSHFVRTTSNASGIRTHFPFGSFTRGTMLPRNMDPHSDVDYLIIFDDVDLHPQSCLQRLKRFVEKHYQQSEIYQSHPTVILSLNHIRFELVPAIETRFGGIQIATKNSLLSKWVSTSPNEFNAALTEKNKSNGNLIKPLVRAVKYWNASNGYPFESFKLENIIVNHWTLKTAFSYPNLWTRFRDFMNELSGDSARQNQSIDRAQRDIEKIVELERQDEFTAAEKMLKRLLPKIK